MNRTPLVSIIMPVYGVEKYIANSIESILNQTFSDFELIIVDDCSPDKSMKIVEEYTTKNEKIKTEQTPRNLGLGGARNFGLNIASGDYVLFVDSDDFLDKYAVEELYNLARKYNSQLIICGFYEVYCDSNGNIKEKVPIYPKNNVFKSSDEIHRQFAQLDVSTIGRFAWNKLYKRQFLIDNNIKFEKIEPIEDICFNLKVYNFAESMVTLNKPLYYYFKRVNVNTLSSKYDDNLFSLFKERYTRIKEYHREWGISDDYSIQTNYTIFLRHIIVLIQKISMNNRLNKFDKKVKIKVILNDLVVRQCMHKMECTSLYYMIIKFLINIKAVSLLIFFSNLIYSIKLIFPKYYSKLRSRG